MLIYGPSIIQAALRACDFGHKFVKFLAGNKNTPGAGSQTPGVGRKSSANLSIPLLVQVLLGERSFHLQGQAAHLAPTQHKAFGGALVPLSVGRNQARDIPL